MTQLSELLSKYQRKVRGPSIVGKIQKAHLEHIASERWMSQNVHPSRAMILVEHIVALVINGDAAYQKMLLPGVTKTEVYFVRSMRHTMTAKVIGLIQGKVVEDITHFDKLCLQNLHDEVIRQLVVHVLTEVPLARGLSFIWENARMTVAMYTLLMTRLLREGHRTGLPSFLNSLYGSLQFLYLAVIFTDVMEQDGKRLTPVLQDNHLALTLYKGWEVTVTVPSLLHKKLFAHVHGNRDDLFAQLESLYARGFDVSKLNLARPLIEQLMRL